MWHQIRKGTNFVVIFVQFVSQENAQTSVFVFLKWQLLPTSIQTLLQKLNWAFCHSIVRVRYIERTTLIQKSTGSHNFSNAKFRANAYTNTNTHQEANSKAYWWTYNTAINHTNRFSDIVCKVFGPLFWYVVYNCQEFLHCLFFLLWHKLIGAASCLRVLKSYYSNLKEIQLKILSFILTILVVKKL